MLIDTTALEGAARNDIDREALAAMIERATADAPRSPAPTDSVASLLAEHAEHSHRRVALVAAEEAGEAPEWDFCDATAYDLADRLAHRLRALTEGLQAQAAEWRRLSDVCDPGRESNDSIEDCEGTAMAGVYDDAVRAIESLLNPA